MSWIVKLTRAADRGASRHRGFVAVLVLAAIGLLTALVMEAQARTRGRLHARAGAFTELKLQAALSDSVRRAMLRLADDEDLLVDSPLELWAKPEEVGVPTGITVRVEISDACARFDLNNLHLGVPDLTSRGPDEILMDLMTASGDFQPSSRAAALRDWIDPDQDGLRERPYYEAENLPFRPANRRLATLAEITGVAGFDREFLLEKAKPRPGQEFRHAFRDLVTVVPVERDRPLRVNVNTAARPVLQALLGAGESAMVETVLVARQSAPVRGLDLFLPGLDPRQQNTLLAYADVRSEFFEIRARAYQPGGGGLAATVLVQRDPAGKVTVLRWSA
jgi:type II secretory pathway component PulK